MSTDTLRSLIANWRGFLARSMALALAMLLHLGLVLFLMCPPTPWSFGPSRSSAGEPALRLELLPRLQRSVAARKAEHPGLRVPHIKQTVPAYSHSPAVLSATPASNTPPVVESAPPPSAPAIPYGNAAFARALDNARSGGLPALPGSNPVSIGLGTRVVPPPSLKSIMRATGKLLNCKNALFKGRMTDEELLKRGLTEQQMQQAYTELGC